MQLKCARVCKVGTPCHGSLCACAVHQLCIVVCFRRFDALAARVLPAPAVQVGGEASEAAASEHERPKFISYTVTLQTTDMVAASPNLQTTNLMPHSLRFRPSSPSSPHSTSGSQCGSSCRPRLPKRWRPPAPLLERAPGISCFSISRPSKRLECELISAFIFAPHCHYWAGRNFAREWTVGACWQSAIWREKLRGKARWWRDWVNLIV